MIRLLAFLFLLALPGPGLAAAPELEFAEDMVARFSAAAPDAEFQIGEADPLEIEVSGFGQMEEGQINLHRIFNHCQQLSDDECETEKTNFATAVFGPPPDRSRESLRIIVRDQQYVDYVLQLDMDEANRPVLREIGEGLFALLAVDSPNSIALSNRRDIEDFGLGESEAWDLAMRQTRAILPELPAEQIVSGQPMAFEEYEYLASLLAFTDDWTAIARDAPPELFVTAVSDGFVFVAFLPDGPDLDEFKATVADDCAAQARCVSPHIYRFRNGRWVIAD